MTKHCCRPMTSFSMSLEESRAMQARIKERFGDDMSILPQPPIVDFVPQLGIYTIASVHIRHCPWCGAGLPMPDLSAYPEISSSDAN